MILSKDDLVSQVSLLKMGEFFAEGRYLPLKGEDFVLRGDDFPLRGDDFPVRGEECQKSTLCPIPTKLCMVISMDMPNKRKIQKQVID